MVLRRSSAAKYVSNAASYTSWLDENPALYEPFATSLYIQSFISSIRAAFSAG
eukprot:CAMPEP_0184734698 /NCGR_PEP_ID=MMETSP0314-20130426/61296_1 /TAXON_ID=38298 /ORGANISM="Rhodella maculata, Strain CCMP 736" /LENGTH=52 /DNA_ID=CAMNT_0027201691 /DNA_START=545 /DNA_END=703 /DNA_ORIENTATION=-